MRTYFAFFLVLALAGCATRKYKEVVSFHDRPLEVVVEIVAVTPRFDSAPNRYLTTLSVLEPSSRRMSRLHLLIDGMTVDGAGLFKVGDCLKLSIDEDAFDQERLIGFSFWKYSDPKPVKQPNKSLQSTPTLVMPPAEQASRQP